MPWHPRILQGFSNLSPRPFQNNFTGPYTGILFSLIPEDTGLMVGPRCRSQSTVDLDVLRRHKPVFVLRVNTPKVLKNRLSRKKADEEMRRDLRDLRGECPISTLHGVCAMGTRLCFYHVPSHNQESEVYPPIVTDMVPEGQWNCDVLDAEGETRLRAVVAEIIQACAALDHQ